MGKTEGQVTIHLVDLNQTILRSVATALPAGSRLETVSIGLDATANFDPRAGSGVKGDFRVENLVLTNPGRTLPKAPAALLVKLDGALKGDVAELRLPPGRPQWRQL